MFLEYNGELPKRFVSTVAVGSQKQVAVGYKQFLGENRCVIYIKTVQNWQFDFAKSAFSCINWVSVGGMVEEI